MIELSSVFQQYVVEYIFTKPGSSEEEKWFSSIMSSFGLAIEVDSSLISKPFLAQFLSIVMRRNNPDHVSRLKRIFEKREDVDNSRDISEPIFNALSAGYQLNSAIDPSKRKLRISYPVYLSGIYGSTSLVNPYEEFIYWAVDNYYGADDVEDKSPEYVSQTGNVYLQQILLETFAKSDDIKIGNLDVLQEAIDIADKDGNHICYVSVMTSTFAMPDSANDEKRHMFCVDFRHNDSFDYLFDGTANINDTKENSGAGSVFYINSIPGLNNQCHMLCCMIRGLVNFSKFKRFHKKNAATMSGILSYCNSVFTFGGQFNIVYGYDEAYLTYRKDKNSKESETIVISYKGYVEKIDKFVNSHTNI